MTDYRYECVVTNSADDMMEHRPAWEDFSTRQLEENIYISFPWLLATLRQYGEAMAPWQIVFVYRHEGEKRDMVGFAAFSVLAPNLLVPVPVLSTLKSPHGYLSHPVFDRDDADRAFLALWDWMNDRSQPWRIILFDQLPDRSPVWDLVRAEATSRKQRVWLKYATSRSMLRRVDSFDTYLAGLARGRRRSFGRLWRKLSAEYGAEVRLHRDRGTAPDLAERFLKLEARSWKGEAGTALACTDTGQRFFEEIIDAYDERGELFCVEMVVDGDPIGMTINFVQGNTLFAFKTAYDPGFRTFSPGISTEVHSIRSFLEATDLETAESGTTGDSYIDDYWNDEADIMAVYVSTPRPSARLVLGAVELATKAKRVLERTIRRESDKTASDALDR